MRAMSATASHRPRHHYRAHLRDRAARRVARRWWTEECEDAMRSARALGVAMIYAFLCSLTIAAFVIYQLSS